MGGANIGSLANQILVEIDGSSYLSGAPLLSMVNNVVLRVEQYTGQTIGSTNIADKYQFAIVTLTKAQVCMDINLQGGALGELTVGDFTAKKAGGSNMTSASSYFQQSGEQALKELGRRSSSVRVLGV